jgi:hypothetical protein
MKAHVIGPIVSIKLRNRVFILALLPTLFCRRRSLSLTGVNKGDESLRFDRENAARARFF